MYTFVPRAGGSSNGRTPPFEGGYFGSNPSPPALCKNDDMKNNSKIMDGYLAIVLTEESQQTLLAKFPPSYAKVYAHHVTVAFKPTAEVYEKYKKYLGLSVALRVYGYAKDEKGEAVVVDGELLKDRMYHITLSTDNVSPVYSNTLLEKWYSAITEPFLLQGVFEFIERK